MTSCIASACPVDTNFDVDTVYFSLSRCGLDEESFNALFQYVVLVDDGVDTVRAYAAYCDDMRQENAVREHMKRSRLQVITLATMFDVVEEYHATVHLARYSDIEMVDSVQVVEALDWVATSFLSVRHDTQTEEDFFRSDRLVSIIMGGAA
jgi:hypothetical protein